MRRAGRRHPPIADGAKMPTGVAVRGFAGLGQTWNERRVAESERDSWITWAYRYRAGRVIAHFIVIAFVTSMALTFVRGFLPKETGWHRGFPWAMFKAPSSRTKRLRVTATLADGSEARLDPSRYYHYTRGFTDLRIYDHCASLRKDRRWAVRESRRWARQLAEWAKRDDGLDVIAVRFDWVRRRVVGRKRRAKLQPIHTLFVLDERRFRALEREGKVSRVHPNDRPKPKKAHHDEKPRKARPPREHLKRGENQLIPLSDIKREVLSPANVKPSTSSSTPAEVSP